VTFIDDRPDSQHDQLRRATTSPPDSPITSVVLAAMVGLITVLVLGLVTIGIIALLQDDGGSTGSGAGDATTLSVELSEFAFTGDLTAPAGRVMIDVSNGGSMEHNLTLVDPNVQGTNLAPGASETLDLGELAAGTYQLICTVPGHADSGMTADLVITDGAATDTGSTDGDATAMGDMAGMDHSAMSGDEMDQAMVESMLAFPAETEGVGNQPLDHMVMPDGTKQFELTAAVTPWEVSPGKIVDAWTYNGMVPGPMIEVDVGDKVRVILHNETPMGTDIHWHGVGVANEQDGVSPYTQDVVASGESYTYEFTTYEPAIAMYHAHIHGQTSVPNGMFASIVVGENPLPRGQTISGVTIPDDLVPDVEMPMVVNDAGVIGLSLNGKSFPATAPVVVEEGDWVAVNYYNEGLMAHPMHLHQFDQLVYAKDGIPLDAPYWADTVNIAPGERYSVLFQATDPGTWVWHCHILTHVESDEGMFGMATAIVVNPAE
jgi:manganese oxidase